MRRVGAALREALNKEETGKEARPSRGTSALGLNDARVLSYLSYRPCSRKCHIADGLSLSTASVDWHLRKLAKWDLVSSRVVEGGRAFMPVGMLQESETRLFELLAFAEKRALFHELVAADGAAQEALQGLVGASRQTVAKWLGEFEELGLLYSVRDGRKVRYYPSELMRKGADEHLSRRKPFLDAIVGRLGVLGLKPKIVKSDPMEVHILIGPPGSQVTLRLGLNPYSTALWLDNKL